MIPHSHRRHIRDNSIAIQIIKLKLKKFNRDRTTINV